MDHLPFIKSTRIKRHTDVSQGPRYILQGPTASDYDAECTAAPNRIPHGYYHRKRHKLSKREATAHRRTSYTLEESRTRPTPAIQTSTKNMHQHSHRDRVIPRPRMRQETRGEDRKVLLPRRGPQAIPGEGGIRRHPHRARGYNAHNQEPSTTSPPPSPRFAHEWTTPMPSRAHRIPPRTLTLGAPTTACSSRRRTRLST